jgi:hypothetical protein
MQTSGKFQMLLGDGNKKVGAQCRPDLNGDTVATGREEPSQSQVLFDPTEKQFDLPTAFVDCGHDKCRQLKVVGQKNREGLLSVS